MRFAVLDVGHGFCAYAVAENGSVALFDCGHNTDPEFRPSDYFLAQGITQITRMFVTNYDEDHISDIVRLRSALSVRILHRNKSISPEILRAIKEEQGPISPAMESLLEMMGRYSAGPPQPPPPMPGLEWTSFWNKYPAFEDTNNCSLVTLLDCGETRFLIPGDVEVEGWHALLERQSVRDHLSTVDVFIASHHGRESGYCPEVFDCASNVDVVIISDGPKEHATQEMVNEYAQHAGGVMFNGELRRVLTTRKDGSIYWNW